MNTLLVDIDVILDVLIKREPFFAASANLWAKIEEKQLDAFLATHTVTTLFYLIRKSRGNNIARMAIKDILSVFEVVPINKKSLLLALDLDFNDFEDAVQPIAAKQIGAHFIITRNIKHYKNSDIPALSPDLYLATLDSMP